MDGLIEGLTEGETDAEPEPKPVGFNARNCVIQNPVAESVADKAPVAPATALRSDCKNTSSPSIRSVSVERVLRETVAKCPSMPTIAAPFVFVVISVQEGAVPLPVFTDRVQSSGSPPETTPVNRLTHPLV